MTNQEEKYQGRIEQNQTHKQSATQLPMDTNGPQKPNTLTFGQKVFLVLLPSLAVGGSLVATAHIITQSTERALASTVEAIAQRPMNLNCSSYYEVTPVKLDAQK